MQGLLHLCLVVVPSLLACLAWLPLVVVVGGGCCSEFGFFIWEDDNDVSRRVLVRINRKAGGTWLGQPAPHMVTEARCRFCCSGAPLRGTLLGSEEPVPTGAAGHRGAQLSDTVLFYFSSSTRVYRNFWQPGLLST